MEKHGEITNAIECRKIDHGTVECLHLWEIVQHSGLQVDGNVQHASYGEASCGTTFRTEEWSVGTSRMQFLQTSNLSLTE